MAMTLSVAGEPYRCQCGCNTFHDLGTVPGTPRQRYCCTRCDDVMEAEPNGAAVSPCPWKTDEGRCGTIDCAQFGPAAGRCKRPDREAGF